MVKGRDKLRAQLNRVPRYIQAEVKDQLEKEADKLVRMMDAIKPSSDIDIRWTWGKVPAGVMRIGQVRVKEYAKMSISIYATASSSEYPEGFPALARWWEFGTTDRFTKDGQYRGRIEASPYFWPSFRSSRKNIKGNLSRAVSRAVKKANRGK